MEANRSWTDRACAWARASVLGVLAVAPLAFALGTAQADPEVPDPQVRWAVGTSGFTVAQAIARQHWGVEACNGQVAIEWRLQEPTINAVSSWTNPQTAYDTPQLNGDCAIAMNPTAVFDWPKFCTVVVHEYGHLVGRRHVDAPGDVMAAIYDGPLPACRQTPEPPAPVGAAPLPTPDRGVEAQAATPAPVTSSKRRAATAMRARARAKAQRPTTTRARAKARARKAARARARARARTRGARARAATTSRRRFFSAHSGATTPLVGPARIAGDLGGHPPATHGGGCGCGCGAPAKEVCVSA